jgi:GNAT superfamily N-acetyltransferase
LEVRLRRACDVEELHRVADAVRALNGYPPRQRDLFSAPEALAAWVAVDAGAVVGHVALHGAGAAPVIALAATATGWPAERLAVVSRLLVAPAARRRGAGAMLLDHAVAEAHAIERWPVLDVATQFDAAIALYQSRGWTRAGRVSFPFRDGTTVRAADSFVYLGPPPPGG